MKRIAYMLLAAAIALDASNAHGQTSGACADPIRVIPTSLTDARSGLTRTLDVLHHRGASRLHRNGGDAVVVCVDSVPFARSWGTSVDRARLWELAPVDVSAQRNSAYPRSENDGPAWNGVGLNATASAGVRAQWRWLRASVRPSISYHENADHRFLRASFIGASEFANPYHDDIDLPKRFGDESFSTFDPGQSFVGAVVGPVDVRFSTENVWVGNAEVYPIILSSTAPGFPHVGISTTRPLNIGIGKIELNLIFGSVSESDYFDGDPDNDSHYLGVSQLVFQPRPLPGLYLGVVRAFHDTAHVGGRDVLYYIENIYDNPFTFAARAAPGNALGAIYARWVLPESGFEAYVEWTREDAIGDLSDVLREPDWTQGYVLGFQKTYAKASRLTRFYGELIHIGPSNPERGGRGGGFSYYTHALVRQGHTHRGQLLGAAIGPGSDAQLLGVDRYDARSWTGVRLQRSRFDEGTYYQAFARRFGQSRHDVELMLSLGHARTIGPFEVVGKVDIARRYDRDFITLSSTEAERLSETSVGTSLRLQWHPR